MMRSVIAAPMATLMICLITSGAMADDHGDRRELRVSGIGKASAVPDMGIVTLGVIADGKEAKAALDANSEAMRRIMAQLKEAGLAPRDIQTSAYTLQPQYRRPGPEDNRNDPMQIIGYQVRNQVTAKVRDLDRMGDVLDRAVGDGANQIDHVALVVEDPENALDQAQARAIADAKRKATIYARTAGVELDEIVSITEAGAQRPQAMMAQARMESFDAGPPIAAGEHEFTASVNIVYEIR